MRVLLLYPAFPPSFWSFEKTVRLVGRKAMIPPLGLITAAALCPQDWEFRLVDQNVHGPTEADWDWAEMVMLSAMIVQKDDLQKKIAQAKRRGKTVVVGGPYPTAFAEATLLAAIHLNSASILLTASMTGGWFHSIVSKVLKQSNAPLGSFRFSSSSPMRFHGMGCGCGKPGPEGFTTAPADAVAGSRGRGEALHGKVPPWFVSLVAQSIP